MAAYYNEINKFAAAWLRNLIKAGHIADGYVDERSIEEITPNELKEFKQCHFFAGIGIWSLALRKAGWSDEERVWTGSCPCQPFSQAGKGDGFNDQRHLWPSFHYLIEQCQPKIVFGEQVAGNDGYSWLDLVQSDLEKTNYATAAVELCAAGFGAPHIRQRLYWVAHTNNDQRKCEIISSYAEKNAEAFRKWEEITIPRKPSGVSESVLQSEVCNKYGKFIPDGACKGKWGEVDWLECFDGRYRPIESGLFPLVDGDTKNLEKLRAYGNAIAAPVAEGFVKAYLDIFES